MQNTQTSSGQFYTLAARVFVISVFLLLLLTLFGKVFFLFENPALAAELDKTTGLTFRTLTALGAAFEVILMIALMTKLSSKSKLFTILYCGCMFGSYRLFKEPQGFCPCLGKFADWTNLTNAQVDKVLNGLVLYFVLGSLLLLAARFLPRSRSPAGELAAVSSPQESLN